MPTFTTIALETLLEPRLTTDSYKNSSNSNQYPAKFLHVTEAEKEKKKNPHPPTPTHIYISPALYTTPEPTPVTCSSVDSLSPSPYVVNRKGRAGKSFSHRIHDDNRNSNGGEGENGGELGAEEGVCDDFLGAEMVGERDEEAVFDEDFFDPRWESSSVASSSGQLNGFGREVENLNSAASNQGEFFDADEDFFSDGSVSNVPFCGQSIESVLRATRLSLLEEIEKRKTAEDALDLMYSQWQRVADVLSQSGLTFPTASNSSMQLEVNSIEHFVQEVVIARFVAEAIGKGQARAEAEIAAEAIIQSKDQEFSRLRDRLQYYEAVNHEMSQRNQEVMELARRQRQRRKGRQQRWLWGCIGLSVAIGASVIACSCLPHISTDSSDASCISSSESA